MVRESGKRSQAAVLVEEMRTELAKVAEGHSSLARAISEMRSDLGGRLESLEKMTTGGFQAVWQAINQNTEQVAGLNTRLDQTNQKLDRLVVRFDTHERAHQN